MMARDMKKKAEKDKESVNRIYYQRGLKIRKDSGIPEALERMSSETGIGMSTYIIACIREALIRDGYLKEE